VRHVVERAGLILRRRRERIRRLRVALVTAEPRLLRLTETGSAGAAEALLGRLAVRLLRLAVARLSGLLTIRRLLRLTVPGLSGLLAVRLLRLAETTGLLRRLAIRLTGRLAVRLLRLAIRLLRLTGGLTVTGLLRLTEPGLSGRLAVRLTGLLAVAGLLRLAETTRLLRRLTVRLSGLTGLSVSGRLLRLAETARLLRRWETLLLRRLEALLRIARLATRTRLLSGGCRCRCRRGRTRTWNLRCCNAEHRLCRLSPARRCARLHRWHRSTARSARRSVHQNGRATVRTRPSWSRHRSVSPVLSRAER
jgi:hypothetical protein